MSEIEMPKTYKERLLEMDKGDAIVIDQKTKSSWAKNITLLHRANPNVTYTVRKNRVNGAIGIWRIK